MQIRNVNNTVVANYEYDAWGKVVSIKYANGNDINVSNHIGVINPIRYRGYYYDSETGFYYLKSRYYDPAICRFISTDGRIDLNDATTNLNLFAYCGNDPVNRIDSEGEFWKELKEIGKSFCEAGIAVVMVATAVAAVGGAITGTIMSGVPQRLSRKPANRLSNFQAEPVQIKCKSRWKEIKRPKVLIELIELIQTSMKTKIIYIFQMELH